MSATGSGDSGWPAEFDEVVEQLKESLALHSGDVTPVADLAQVLVLAAEQRHVRRVRWTVSAVALLIAVALAGIFAGTGGSNSDVHVASGPVSTAPTTQRATSTTVAATTTAPPTTVTPTTVAPPPTTVPHVTTPNLRAPSGTVPLSSGPTCSPNAPDPTTPVGQLFTAVNGDRAANGEGPLCWNNSLAGTASTWTSTMSVAGAISHPSDLGSMCAGVPGWTSCTQNVGGPYLSVSAINDDFMADSQHRANILGQPWPGGGGGGSANMVGIDIVVVANGQLWATVNFAFA